jgi:predicted RNA-binding protein YlxR (DUF448 family)
VRKSTDQRLRTCVGCRQRGTQEELLRCVYGESGALVDRHGHGRGAWLCNVECARMAQRSDALSRAWRTKVAASEVEELIRSIESVTAEQV